MVTKNRGEISVDGRGYTRDVEADLNSKAYVYSVQVLESSTVS